MLRESWLISGISNISSVANLEFKDVLKRLDEESVIVVEVGSNFSLLIRLMCWKMLVENSPFLTKLLSEASIRTLRKLAFRENFSESRVLAGILI